MLADMKYVFLVHDCIILYTSWMYLLQNIFQLVKNGLTVKSNNLPKLDDSLYKNNKIK